MVLVRVECTDLMTYPPTMPPPLTAPKFSLWPLLLLGLIAAGLPVKAADTENLPRATDLRKEAAPGRPLVILFSRADCPYCRQARVYLRPMAKDKPTADQAVYRQIDLDTTRPLKDFQGHPTTHEAFAASEKIKLTPTVVFYGPGGERLAKPIVGMKLPDFYNDYLTQTLAQARRQMGLADTPQGDKP